MDSLLHRILNVWETWLFGGESIGRSLLLCQWGNDRNRWNGVLMVVEGRRRGARDKGANRELQKLNFQTSSRYSELLDTLSIDNLKM